MRHAPIASRARDLVGDAGALGLGGSDVGLAAILAAALLLREAAPVKRARELRLDLERTVEIRDRGIGLRKGEMREASPVEREGIIGSERERLVASGECCLRLGRDEMLEALRAEGSGILRIERDGLRVIRQGAVLLGERPIDAAASVIGSRESRIDLMARSKSFSAPS